MVDLPLCDRQIPVIADSYVDKDFGSGVVKITGAHDFNDYQVALRHGLPLITIFTLDAKINDNGPAAYRGMDRYVARKAILRDLEALGLLEKAVPHKHAVPICVRTSQVVEPMLTDQWFVAMTKPGKDGTTLAGKAIEAVETGAVKFFPEQWVNTYNQWMHHIQGLDDLAPALVGPPDPGLVRRRRRDLRGAERRGRTCQGDRCGLQRRPDARPRRARHLVLVGDGCRSRRSAGRRRPRSSPSSCPRACSSPATTSSSSGSPG